MISIRCTKGFLLEGSDFPIMKGEMFKLVDAENNEFEGIDGKSANPGMAISFYSEQLLNNFEFVVGR
jgi:hypothetical protein